jgi:general L-amino acid transport system permease protein
MRAAANLSTSWRERLFGTPTITTVTLLLAAAIAWIAVPIVRWALIDATWSGQTRNDCTGTGACWVFVKARFGQFMYGFYPLEERWRPNLAGLAFALSGAAIVFAPKRLKLGLGLAALVILPPLGVWLLGGGLGLRAIETREWGGLMLTVFISIYASLIAIPLGILLALGRQSELKVVKLISVLFIEFWRGVPIIAVIFLASLLLPLIMPAGIGVDRLARAVIGLGFCIAAYMAEAVRGGLQALRISLPAITNEFIALVKNTTLVLVVSILDLLGIAQASLADPNWVGMNMEAYVFSGGLYWLICFALSRWSRSMERQR